MVWFGKPLLLAGIYAPISLAGLIFPRLYLKSDKVLTSVQNIEALLGFGVVQGLFAAFLTALGAKSGYMSAIWCVASILGAFILSTFVSSFYHT